MSLEVLWNRTGRFVRAHVLSPEQHTVLRDIGRCRTAALGGCVNVHAACGHAEVGLRVSPCVMMALDTTCQAIRPDPIEGDAGEGDADEVDSEHPDPMWGGDIFVTKLDAAGDLATRS